MSDIKLSDLKGIGEKRLNSLHDAGIYTLADLLSYYPVSYKDTSKIIPLSQVKEGDFVCVEGSILSSPKIQYVRSGLNIVRCTLTDGVYKLPLIYFNQPWNMKNLYEGREIPLYGRASMYKGNIVLVNAEVVQERGIIPHYKAIENIGTKTMEGIIEQALEYVDSLIVETLSDEIIEEFSLIPLKEAVRQVHRPVSGESLNKAKRRIAFDNILYYQIAVMHFRRRSDEGIKLSVTDTMQEEYSELLPFKLTEAQNKAISDIEKDFVSGKAMNRLLQGDVGSGKTAVAFAAVYYMHKAGYQTALMAPTETLAYQHIESAKKLLEPAGIKCGLLIGGMKAADRKHALDSILFGEWSLVIGTHALISESVEYKSLGLVITDEQHRFGVRQRKRLSDKAEIDPHVLVLSATPIPRTLALVIYGDLDVSTMRGLPPGRLPVKTRIVPENKRKDMYAFIRQAVNIGERVYYICPLVEESDKTEAKSVQEMYDELSKGALRGLKIGITYGSQNAEDKKNAINDFSSGKTSVLVATTVVEVGIDVPQATIIVIENADRFGLSQLHQLRGRVGRGKKQSWCFLLGERNERLSAMCETNDGFEIAEKDLQIRGPGEFLGTMQHGKATFSIMTGDMRLIEDAQKCAKYVIENSKKHDKLIDAALKKYSYAAENIALN